MGIVRDLSCRNLIASANRNLLAAALAEIDIEVGQRAVAAHESQLRHIEVSGVEKVELILQIKVKQALHRTVCRDDTSRDTGFLRLFLQLVPIFVFATSGYRDG